MQPITLSKEQRVKLLEMAKKLFPEYINWQFSDVVQIRSANDKYAFFENNDYLVNTDKNNNHSNYIHWFEFCMGALSGRICDKLTEWDFWGMSKSDFDKITNIPFRYKSFWKRYMDECSPNNLHNGKPGVHPVDYLYEQFLKLK